MTVSKSTVQSLVMVAVFAFQLTTSAGAQSEAEATAKRFAEALSQFQVAPMVEEMHSDMYQFCHQMAVHIAETTKAQEERGEFLKELGVKNLKELRKLTPKNATVKFYQYAFSNVPSAVKEAALQSKVTFVGSLFENELVHVLYRSEANLADWQISVPSVVTLKRVKGKFKVVSTTQFESMKAQLQKEMVR